jgi:hypothetical protein
MIKLKTVKDNLDGDIMLSSSYIAYFGIFDVYQRDILRK